MKIIRLHPGGERVLIDNEDFESVSKYKWWKSTTSTGKSEYAYTTIFKNGKRTSLLMHTLIFGEKQIDHKNKNGLDNRKQNLRLATHSQNRCNQSRKKNNRSGFKSVFKYGKHGRYYSQIQYLGKNHYIGSFDTPEEASKAYFDKAKQIHGEFASL